MVMNSRRLYAQMVYCTRAVGFAGQPMDGSTALNVFAVKFTVNVKINVHCLA